MLPDGVIEGPAPAFGRGLLTIVVEAPGADTLVTKAVTVVDGGGGVTVPPEHTGCTGPPVTCDSVRSLASVCEHPFRR